MAAEELGGLCALLVFALPSFVLLFLACRAKSRAKSLTNASLGFGLALFPLIGVLSNVRERRDIADGLTEVVGGLTIAAAVLGIILAIWVLIMRRRPDGGWTVAGPILAILFSLGGLCTGAGMLAIPGATSDTGTPWVYTSPQHQIQITLPSADWKQQTKNQEGSPVRFSRNRPTMLTSILKVVPAVIEVEYSTAIIENQSLVANSSVQAPETIRDVNADGEPCWIMLGTEKTARGLVLVGMSVTWVGKKQAVVVIFEGQHQMLSKFGQEREQQAFQASAMSILTSVKTSGK